MIRIRGTLLPDHILLDLTAHSRDEAVRQLVESLRSDTRVADLQKFSQALRKRDDAGKVKLEYGLAVPHVRTAAVTKMVMAFGRLKEPVQDSGGPISSIVLVGIPETMDAEYLRLVGTLMRVFRSEKLRKKILMAEKPAQIIDLFERVETGEEGGET
jgi:mannitol/fructose-specific phosphotransferase system IIA component (Ntr-type)